MPSVYIPAEFDAPRLTAAYLMGWGDGYYEQARVSPAGGIPGTPTFDTTDHAYRSGYDKGQSRREIEER